MDKIVVLRATVSIIMILAMVLTFFKVSNTTQCDMFSSIITRPSMSVVVIQFIVYMFTLLMTYFRSNDEEKLEEPEEIEPMDNIKESKSHNTKSLERSLQTDKDYDKYSRDEKCENELLEYFENLEKERGTTIIYITRHTGSKIPKKLRKYIMDSTREDRIISKLNKLDENNTVEIILNENAFVNTSNTVLTTAISEHCKTGKVITYIPYMTHCYSALIPFASNEIKMCKKAVISPHIFYDSEHFVNKQQLKDCLEGKYENEVIDYIVENFKEKSNYTVSKLKDLKLNVNTDIDKEVMNLIEKVDQLT